MLIGYFVLSTHMGFVHAFYFYLCVYIWTFLLIWFYVLLVVIFYLRSIVFSIFRVGHSIPLQKHCWIPSVVRPNYSQRSLKVRYSFYPYMLSSFLRMSSHFCSLNFTFKYCWHWGAEIHGSPWQIPYPCPRNINGFHAWIMISEHLYEINFD